MPNTMSAAVISVVITGRRMQVSEMFTSGSGLAFADGDARLVGQQEVPVGDDDVALLEAALDDAFGPERPRHLDWGDGSDIVPDHVDEVALLAALDGERGHHDRLLGAKGEPRGDEGAGPQQLVIV